MFKKTRLLLMGSHVAKRCFLATGGQRFIASSLLKTKCLIDGQWTESESRATFAVLNPYDGTEVARVPEMNEVDVNKAITAATKAFEKWRLIPAKQRSNALRKWYDLCSKHEAELAHILTCESGKPISESVAEVKYGNSFLEWFAEEARRIDGEIIASPVASKRIFLIKQPIGPVAIITPWNFPHAMVTRKVAAALASGCTAVIKPSEETPLTALALADLAQQAGIPDGIFNVVTCSLRENVHIIGKRMCSSTDIAGVFFTGSTDVGKLLYKQCSTTVKRIGLELGGNAPFIVFESANLELALEGAMASKFRNCGQTCVSANRFLVHRSLIDRFVGGLLERINTRLQMGDILNSSISLGPLINHSQHKKVTEIVRDACEKGAKMTTAVQSVAGLKSPLFFAPTVLEQVNSDMRCYKEEIFGPVIVCIPFDSADEALAIANSSRSGLAGYFYSNDLAQIVSISEKLEVGMVGINDGAISMTEAAFGGVKESGIGREGSHHGIDDYTFIKYLCLGNL